MNATRRARLQAVIQEELSVLVPREIKDPRVPPLTLTSVVVSPDGSQAKVGVLLLGSGIIPEDDSEASKAKRREVKECLAGLSSATPFLRRHLARALSVRHVPELLFHEDRGYANTVRVQELLREIASANPPVAKSDPESKD